MNIMGNVVGVVDVDIVNLKILTMVFVTLPILLLLEVLVNSLVNVQLDWFVVPIGSVGLLKQKLFFVIPIMVVRIALLGVLMLFVTAITTLE